MHVHGQVRIADARGVEARWVDVLGAASSHAHDVWAPRELVAQTTDGVETEALRENGFVSAGSDPLSVPANPADFPPGADLIHHLIDTDLAYLSHGQPESLASLTLPPSLQRGAFVVAHPDDEVLWFSSVLAVVGKVILCYEHCTDLPELTAGRRRVAAKFAESCAEKFPVKRCGAQVGVVRTENASPKKAPRDGGATLTEALPICLWGA